MALEVRYLGTRGSNQWSDLDWNAIRGENIVANGFLDEFKLAMANLTANNAAALADPAKYGNRKGSFAYFGPGTNPLPIYLAYFTGKTDTMPLQVEKLYHEYNGAAAFAVLALLGSTLTGRVREWPA